MKKVLAERRSYKVRRVPRRIRMNRIVQRCPRGGTHRCVQTSPGRGYCAKCSANGIGTI